VSDVPRKRIVRRAESGVGTGAAEAEALSDWERRGTAAGLIPAVSAGDFPAPADPPHAMIAASSTNLAGRNTATPPNCPTVSSMLEARQLTKEYRSGDHQLAVL
jgi:hypothetical protein